MKRIIYGIFSHFYFSLVKQLFISVNGTSLPYSSFFEQSMNVLFVYILTKGETVVNPVRTCLGNKKILRIKTGKIRLI